MGIVVLSTKLPFNFYFCFTLAERNKFKMKARQTPLPVNDIETSNSKDCDIKI